MFYCSSLGTTIRIQYKSNGSSLMLLSIYSSLPIGKNWNLNFKKWQCVNSQKEKEKKKKKKEKEEEGRRSGRRKKNKEEVKEEERQTKKEEEERRRRRKKK